LNSIIVLNKRVIIVLINLTLLLNKVGNGIYITFSFLKHLFLESILLDNCRVLYLVNIKEIFNLGTFVNVGLIDVIKAGTINFLVSEHKLYIIEKIFTEISKENIIDLLLENVVVIKGFYINIVLESCLRKAGI
jgi:hypothetical protein